MLFKSVVICLGILGIVLCDKHHPDIPKKFKKIATNSDEFEANYWIEGAQNLLKSKIETEPNTNTAKNIIFFIGDGMSIQTVTAARVFAGRDESYSLSFEEFPTFGYSRTYCVSRQVSDSACTATAFLSGVKVNYGTVGVDSNVLRYDCDGFSKEEHHTTNLAQWAMDAGKAVGFVTTTRITDATPAAMYAHSGYRYWEHNEDVLEDNCDPDIVDDIAEQFVSSKLAQKFKVVLGGGRGYFLNNDTLDDEGQRGLRTDHKNLIKEWQDIHQEMGNSRYIWKRDDLMNSASENADYLLGMFDQSHLKYDFEAATDDNEPSLSDMVEVAIKMLSKEEKGYFLFVEGGQIDKAHHSTYARIALDETKEFSNAIRLAKDMSDESDTMIVVSADHAHTMTINGYPDRGADILSIASYSDEDGLPYSTLSYINGPGHAATYNSEFERNDISQTNFENPRLRYYGEFPLSSETHGGDDVGVYANGPWNHLFVGSYEQNSIPYMVAYAAKIGPYKTGSATSISLALSLIFLSFTQIVRVFM